MTGLLEVSGLTMRFGGLVAVQGVDLTLHKSEILGVIGPNGAGKTTLFNMLCGSARPTSGTIRFKGEECSGLAPHEVAAKGVARTFQITSLFPALSVLDNVRIGTHRITTASGFASLFRTRHYREEEEQVDRTAHELLAFLNLSEAAARPAQTLPYGDQRKLEIAVALAARPELLLLDEPAAGMNPDEGRRLVETIKSIRDRGVTVLLVEHHMKVVLGVCDRIIVLDHGIKIAEGEPYEVARRRDVIEVYLGSGASRE